MASLLVCHVDQTVYLHCSVIVCKECLKMCEFPLLWAAAAKNLGKASNRETLLWNSYFFLLATDNGEIMIVKLSPDGN